MNWQFDDGGRKFAGFSGFGNDCVVRAIAIYKKQKYIDVLQRVNQILFYNKRKPVIEKGIPFDLVEKVFLEFGIKQGKTKKNSKILLVKQSQGVHCYVVVEGVVRDIFPPEKNETIIAVMI